MDLSLLNTSLFVLISKAMTDPTPLTQPPQDDTAIAQYTQDFVCYLPEKLRGLHELKIRHSNLGNELTEQLLNAAEAAMDCTELMNAIDCVQLREETLHSLLLSELFLLEPSIAEYIANCVCLSDWKIVRLGKPKMKQKKMKTVPQHTLQ